MQLLNLYRDGRIVGRGYIGGPTCHFRELQDGMVSIGVEDVLVMEAALPFPTEEVANLGEARGSFVIWPRVDVREEVVEVSGSGVRKRRIEREVVADKGSPSVVGLENVATPVAGVNQTMTFTRYTLIEECCEIWHSCRETLAGKGFISFTDPEDAVCDQYLGMSCMGVTVTEGFPLPADVNLRCMGCLYHPKPGMLLRWSNDYVRVGGVKVSELLKTRIGVQPEVISSVGSNAVEMHPNYERPKYTMTIRQPRIVKRPPKSERVTTNEAVLRFRKIACCKRRCASNFTREEVINLRRDFYSMKGSDRVNYVYDMLGNNMRDHRVEKLNLNGKRVCERAWYLGLGISKSGYLKWKADFRAGARKAEHGNTGSMKPKASTLCSAAVFSMFVKENCESMPHRSRRNDLGIRENVRKLSGMFTRTCILEEVNAEVVALTGKKVSRVGFYKTWRRSFRDVTIARKIAFSKCDTCEVIRTKLLKTKDQGERNLLHEQRRAHRLEQVSCRTQYWSWRVYSHRNPTKAVCIIHDKMDQAKTMIPKLQQSVKSLWRLDKLKTSLTGAITHGHGRGTYGNFSLDLWPDDSNFHVGSLNSILRRLEMVHEHGGGHLALPDPSTPSWACALRDTKALASKLFLVGCALPDVVPAPEGPSFKPLPQTLLLQLDNASGQNKNRYVFSYLSYLTYLGVFEEIELGFMMPGHTHEDIDGMFGNLSGNLAKAEVLTMPELLYEFYKCSSKTPVPYVVDKVPDWKGFIDGYIPDGDDRLTGHTTPLAFRFAMNGEWPVTYTKARPSFLDWVPAEGIKMWKADKDGKPLMPVGTPKILPPKKSVKDLGQLRNSIHKHILHWLAISSNRNGNPENAQYSAQFTSTIEYWMHLLQELGKITCVEGCYEDFWPQTRQIAPERPEMAAVVELLATKELAYVGPWKDRPIPEFNPYKDLNKGMFLLVRPGDDLCPTWVGYSTEEPQMDDTKEHFETIQVTWWEPVPVRNQVYPANYVNCWNKRWRATTASDRIDVDTVDFAWSPSNKKKPPITVKIPQLVAETYSALVEERN